MGSKWEQTLLGNVLELKRGYDLPKKSRVIGSIPLISSAGPSDWHAEAKVSGPGVVTGRYGTIGEVFYSEVDFWPLNTTLYVRDFKGNDEKFIYYFLKTIPYLQYSDKAAVPGVNRNHLHLAPIKFPTNRLEQKAIAHILGTLDDKIELNRQTNQTLEALAQALFKSWFVDFDPVIDNALAAGNEIPEPLKDRAAARQELGDARKPLPEKIRREFPDGFQFVDEMGWVPRGWEILSLSELIKIKHGYAFKGEYFTNEAGRDVLVTPGNFKPGGGFQLNKYKYYDGPVPDDYVLKQGDIIVTMTDLSKQSDTLGYPAIVPISAEYRFLHNQRVGLVSEVEECSIGMFVYHVLKSEYCRHTVLGSATGTTVVHTSPKKILAHQTAYSGSGIEAFFDGLVKPYFNRIQELSVESNVLEKLRDTLLPKLLSGQLTIPDAKKLVAGAL